MGIKGSCLGTPRDLAVAAALDDNNAMYQSCHELYPFALSGCLGHCSTSFYAQSENAGNLPVLAAVSC
jgi:hypothetical protein